MYGEESRDILCLINMDPHTVSEEQISLNISLPYFNVLTKEKNTIREKFVIKRVEEVNTERNLLVDKQLNRLKTTDAIERAKAAADSGNLDEARNILTNTIEEIKISISSQDEYCIQLVADLNTIKDTMVNRQTYKSEGDKKTNWIGKAHQKQRKAGGKGDLYSNKDKSKMVSKYKDYSKKKDKKVNYSNNDVDEVD